MENMPPEKGFQPLKKRMKFPLLSNTVQQVKFSIKYFFGKYDQIRSFLRIWSHLLKKYLIENFIFVQWEIAQKTLCKVHINQVCVIHHCSFFFPGEYL